MEPFENRRETLIKLVFFYVNHFNDAEKNAARSMTLLNSENGHMLATNANIMNALIDLSFKLYIVHHTNTEEELAKLDHCSTLLWSIKYCCYNKEKLNQSLDAVRVIKAVYPLLKKDNADLAKLSSFYINLFTHQESPLDSVEATHGIFCYFFQIALKFADVLADVAKNMLDVLQPLCAHIATSTSSQPYWPDVKPIFERCAAEILPSSTPEQIGQIFNRHFKATQAEIDELERKMRTDQCADIEKPQRLELVLRLHGLWNKQKYDDDSFEDEETLRSRMRRNWCKTFRSWYEKQQQRKRPIRERTDDLVEVMEKTLWKRRDPQVLSQSIDKKTGINREKDALVVLPMINDIIAELDGLYDDDPGMKNQ